MRYLLAIVALTLWGALGIGQAEAQVIDASSLLSSTPYLKAQLNSWYFSPHGPCAAPPTTIPSTGGTTWYFNVNTGSDTTGNGTIGNPWAQPNSLFNSGAWGSARLHSINSGSPIMPGDAVLITGSGTYTALNTPGGANLNESDWITIAAAPGVNALFPQISLGDPGMNKFIFYGLNVSEYDNTGTLQTLGNATYHAAVYLAGSSNVIMYGNFVQTAFDSTVYTSWSESQWNSLMVEGMAYPSSTCVVDLDSYRNVGYYTGSSLALDAGRASYIVFGGVVDGYQGDGFHTSQCDHCAVIGAAFLNNNAPNGNHNDTTQIGIGGGCCANATANDLLAAYNTSIRDTGVGRVIWTDGGGNQGFDNFGQTYGTNNFRVYRNFHRSSGATNGIVFLGQVVNSISEGAGHPANDGAPNTTFGYIGYNRVEDDDFFPNIQATGIGLEYDFNTNAPVVITGNAATNFSPSGGSIAGLGGIGTNSCLTPPADRTNGCSLNGY